MEPALHERLQQVSDDQPLPVAIWVAGKPRHTQEEIFAALAAKFPEAQAALARFDKPMAVDNVALAARIRAEYNRMLAEDTAIRIAPLATHLRQRSINVTTYGSLPSMTARLTKRQILELANRNDVGMIYLVEEKGQEATDTAIPTALVPIVWDRGIDGSGATIAILEDGNIDSTVTCLDISDTRNSPQGVQEHNTQVASVAACDHATYRGVAPGATLLDAGFDSSDYPGPLSQQDGVAALQWATDSPHTAPIVNISYVWERDNVLHWTDRAFDYWARAEFTFIAQAAGNTGGSLGSPAKGWVGAGITTIGLGGNPNPVPVNGTSYAAPQVAGLAALLIDRDPTLAAWPEASRAIIMASATHNIVGPTGIPTGQELRDGAGAINAALADTVAQIHNTSSTNPCTASCWWGISINNTNFPVGSYLYRYFTANKGDLIRVAISWWSNADTPANNYSFDRLDTDLHLGALDPDGQWAPGAWSASHDNNYELIEFAAPKTGTYRIAVYKERSDETSNYLGVALVRLHRVYLPVVMKNFP